VSKQNYAYANGHNHKAVSQRKLLTIKSTLEHKPILTKLKIGYKQALRVKTDIFQNDNWPKCNQNNLY